MFEALFAVAMIAGAGGFALGWMYRGGFRVW